MRSRPAGLPPRSPPATRVILKPAPEAVAVGAWIAEQFWRAGVPRDVLQLVVCEDGPVGRHLVTHPDVDTVVLTGAYDTASMFLDWRPDLRVLAETSGKDALVITPSADIDQAIADLVRSAFGHAGQKCSAASLGIVVAEVYDDPIFQTPTARRRHQPAGRRRNRPGDDGRPADRAADRQAGTRSHDPRPGRDLAGRATSCSTRPAPLPAPAGRPAFASASLPARGSIAPSASGPVLGLMRADDLDHAIELQNAGDFGLTGGIHSLDDAEVERWLAEVEIGNAYVNRHITGAIVQRQPFGGWKRSSVGGGAKAGGPGYVAQFAGSPTPSTEPIDRSQR